jgi:hypothetical protein
MKHLPLLFVGLPLICYLLQAAYYFFVQGRHGLCITMVSYSLANVGVIWDSYEIGN